MPCLRPLTNPLLAALAARSLLRCAIWMKVPGSTNLNCLFLDLVLATCPPAKRSSSRSSIWEGAVCGGVVSDGIVSDDDVTFTSDEDFERTVTAAEDDDNDDDKAAESDEDGTVDETAAACR